MFLPSSTKMPEHNKLPSATPQQEKQLLPTPPSSTTSPRDDILTLLQQLPNLQAILGGSTLSQLLPKLVDTHGSNGYSSTPGAMRSNTINQMDVRTSTDPLVDFVDCLSNIYQMGNQPMKSDGRAMFEHVDYLRALPIPSTSSPLHGSIAEPQDLGRKDKREAVLDSKPSPRFSPSMCATLIDSSGNSAITTTTPSSIVGRNWSMPHPAATRAGNNPSMNGGEGRNVNNNVSNVKCQPSSGGVPNWSRLGVPQPATPTRFTAPVHIDVGGVLYTSSLETLTKYPNSRLGRMFNGAIPIVLDTMKQHYFIDRDGALFRHVLNFLRTGQVNLDAHFDELDQLVQEAEHYELDEMIQSLNRLTRSRSTDTAAVFRTKRSILSRMHDHNGKRQRLNTERDSGEIGKQERVCVSDSDIDRVHARQQQTAECIWLEIDNTPPYGGSIQCTNIVIPSKWRDEVIGFLDDQCVCCTHTSAKPRHQESNTARIVWHTLTQRDQLYLWQLLLSVGFRIISTHAPKKAMDTNEARERWIHLLSRME